MSYYRLEASVIGRSAGRSATAAAAYRAADVIECARYGETHDYSRKGGVVHSEILAPENAPDWITDRAALWNAVEAKETRVNSRLAREVLLALPHQLDEAARIELARSFVREQFVRRGLVADLNIHEPDRQGDHRNHHAHVMITTREVTPDGLGKKVRDLDRKESLQAWREEWANYQNRAFERAGLKDRVDHRSLADQGIEQQPTRHEGPAVTAMRRKGKPSRVANDNDAIKEANRRHAALIAQAQKLRQEVEREKDRFARWQEAKRAETAARQHDAARRQAASLEAERRQKTAALAAAYDSRTKPQREAAKALSDRLTKKGLARLVRTLTGRTRRDRAALETIGETLKKAEQRKAEEMARIEKAQAAERAAAARQAAEARQQQEDRLRHAQARKEEALRPKAAQADWLEQAAGTPAAKDRDAEIKRRAAEIKAAREAKQRDKGRGFEPG